LISQFEESHDFFVNDSTRPHVLLLGIIITNTLLLLLSTYLNTPAVTTP